MTDIGAVILPYASGRSVRMDDGGCGFIDDAIAALDARSGPGDILAEIASPAEGLLHPHILADRRTHIVEIAQ